MVEWSFTVVDAVGLDRTNVTIAFSFLDRYLSLRSALAPMGRDIVQLMSIACLYLAVKTFEPGRRLPVGEVIKLCGGLYDVKTIETAEEKAIVARTTANHAAEAKIELDMFSTTDKEAFAQLAQEATNAKYEADMAASEKAQSDKAAAEKAAADRAISAQAAAEKAAVDKAAAEAAALKAIADDGEAKEAAAEEAAAAKAAAEEAEAIAKAEAEAAAAKKAKEEAEAAEKAARAAKLEKLKNKAKDDPEGAYYEIEKMVRSGDGNAEDWEEAKRQADEVVGSLLGVVKSGVTPTPGDVWMIEPTIPVRGGKITVYYNAAATCLAGVKQYGAITLNSGCNNWEEPEATVMKEVKGRFKVNGKPIKAVKGSWWQKAEIEVPDSAFVMDMVFSDGGHQYDNNNRADFHAAVEGAEETLENNRWQRAAELYYQLVEDRVIREEKAKIRNERRAVLRKKSKAAAAEVTRKQREHVLYVDPPEPRAGQTVRVHYNPTNTNLATANLPTVDHAEFVTWIATFLLRCIVPARHRGARAFSTGMNTEAGRNLMESGRFQDIKRHFTLLRGHDRSEQVKQTSD